MTTRRPAPKKFKQDGAAKHAQKIMPSRSADTFSSWLGIHITGFTEVGKEDIGSIERTGLWDGSSHQFRFLSSREGVDGNWVNVLSHFILSISFACGTGQ